MFFSVDTKRSGAPGWSRTPDQPDLERIPDSVGFSQRHETYAVFWPLPHEEPWQTQPLDEEWQTGGVVRRWVVATLDRATGLVRHGTAVRTRQLDLRRVPPVGSLSSRTIKASRSRRCRKNVPDVILIIALGTFRSPLRNHRTGFHGYQGLGDGLFREMAEEGSTPPKLVIFSDSRQDAAKLAGGIERDHYRDIVRQALIRALYDFWDDFVAFLREEVGNNSNDLQRIEELNSVLREVIAVPGLPDEDARRRTRWKQRFLRELMSAADRWFRNRPPVNQGFADQWLALLRSYPGPVPMSARRDAVHDRLLAQGICPGGASWRAVKYRTGEGGARRFEPWFECFDWVQDPPLPRVNRTDRQSEHLVRLKELLSGELMYTFFPHMARTIEGMGR